MSIIDANLLFDPSGTNVTGNATSTNVLDMFATRDMGEGQNDLVATVWCQQSFTAANIAATLDIALQAAPDAGNGTPGNVTQGVYQTFIEKRGIPIGQLQNQTKLIQWDVNTVLQFPVASITSIANTSSNTTMTLSANNTNIAIGMMVVGSGITNGTTVSNVSGTTVTLSNNATSNVTAGTFTFVPYLLRPRFYRLNYTVTNGNFTAGQIMAALVLQKDTGGMYAPGFTVAN